MSNKFYEQISKATQESQVQELFNTELKRAFNVPVIERKYQCDGYFCTEDKSVSVLIEYKYDIQMKNQIQRARLLAQCLGYLKAFEDNKEEQPKLVFCADINECFIIHTNDLIKYLDVDDVDWSVAPCNLGNTAVNLVAQLAQEVTPWVYDIDDKFNIQTVIDQIKNLCSNIKTQTHITEKNIESLYSLFCDRVIKNKDKIAPNDLVGIFIGNLLYPDSYYKHPRKKNTLIARGTDIQINSNEYEAFMSIHSTEYTPKEKRVITAISDRLIEDTKRRRSGEFYTPTIWVDYAHKMISEHFGQRWKEGYVVWDCCFDEYTEFLTPTGFKKISDYIEGDLVLQYNADGTANFTRPKKYIKKEYTDEWVCLTGSQLDICCTKNHNFVVRSDKDISGALFKKSAEELYLKQQKVRNLHLSIPRSFCYDGELVVDEYIIRLAIAINADGTYCPKVTLSGNKSRTKRNTRFTDDDTSIRDVYCISIKKQRKIDRLKYILGKLNKEYILRETSSGYVMFYFHFDYGFNPKIFPCDWYKLSLESKRVFAEEIFLWDGNIQTNHFASGRVSTRKSVSTNKKSDADLISFILNSTGDSVSYVREDQREGRAINYVISQTSLLNAKISNKNNNFYLKKNSLKQCYCFEVESGMLVVRRNNKIYISSNCSGTKNLTRDYYFKELYCSTLEQSEVDLSSNYNKEATSFVYDFLNEDLNSLKNKAPNLVKSLEEDKPIMFFINPPYSNGGLAKKGLSGHTLSNTQQDMLRMDGFKQGELICQFLWRILNIKRQYNLSNVKLALFTKPTWLAGDSTIKFRKLFLSHFKFEQGVLFNAGEFSGVSAQWGITFNLWSCGESENKSAFVHTLVKNVDNNIITLKDDGGNDITKTIYNRDDIDFITVTNYTKPKSEFTVQKTFKLDVKTCNMLPCEKKLPTDWLGFFLEVHGDYIQANNMIFLKGGANTEVGLSASSHGSHASLATPDNFDNICLVNCIRDVIETNWVIDKDIYIIKPNHKYPEQFVNDCIIYSLFSGYTFSMKSDDGVHIKNHMFWLDKDYMLNLAETYNNDDVYEDTLNADNRFACDRIKQMMNQDGNLNISEQAKAVLDKATELVEKSFKLRGLFNDTNPEYQINNWDAGWWQIKSMLKQLMPNELKEFQTLMREFRSYLKPLVYENGFLK